MELNFGVVVLLHFEEPFAWGKVNDVPVFIVDDAGAFEADKVFELLLIF